MVRLVLSFLAVVVLSAPVPKALASNCAVDDYDHNGSLMQLQVCDGGGITISYLRPRSGLTPHGVRDGTLLFDGVEQPNGAISGQARLFNSRCGVITYAVTGSRQGTSIVLRGNAPVRDRNCQISRQRPDTLVFSLVAASPPGSQPSCPPGFVFSNGQCIRGGGAPGPGPAPAPQAGDWHAIAGSFRSQQQAQARASQLGGGWYVMNTAQCPNFTNGYWIATAGPFGKGQAQAYASGARQHGAYVKTCH